MEFSTLLSIIAALFIIVSSSYDIDEMHAKQKEAMITLKAWQKLNRDKEQQK